MAAGKIKGNKLDADVQLCNRMDKLYPRKAAVLQAGTWALRITTVGNKGVQRNNIRYNS